MSLFQRILSGFFALATLVVVLFPLVVQIDRNDNGHIHYHFLLQPSLFNDISVIWPFTIVLTFCEWLLLAGLLTIVYLVVLWIKRRNYNPGVHPSSSTPPAV